MSPERRLLLSGMQIALCRSIVGWNSIPFMFMSSSLALCRTRFLVVHFAVSVLLGYFSF